MSATGVLLVLLFVSGFGLSTAASQAAFPAQNGPIAFSSDRDSADWEIFTVNPDGSGLTRLTRNPAEDHGPAVSPDGTKIAFTSDRDGLDEIYTMNVDGSAVTRLTREGTYKGDVAFSPDGEKIAFSSGRDGNTEIYVMNSDGSGVMRLTETPAYERYPAFSPDGTKIAFITRRDGDEEVYVMDADGSEETNLTKSPASWESYGPSFSPDGRRIAFSSDRVGNDPIRSSSDEEIYVMNLDGSEQTRLTFSERGQAIMPVFSPDGTKIAFSSNRAADASDRFELFVMSADGSGTPERLTASRPFAWNGDLDWGPPLTLPASPPGQLQPGPAPPPPGPVLSTQPGPAQPQDPSGRDSRRPKVRVAGVRRGCVSASFRVRVAVNEAVRHILVRLDRRRVRRTTSTRLSFRVSAKRLKPGRHRLTVRAVDLAGNVTRKSSAFWVCAR